MPVFKILVFLLLCFGLSDGSPKDKNLFISPVRIPLSLSANFAELRADHFHSGIDIRTQGVIGKEVVAAADGYIYRISVTPGGFGKALYLRHPSGYSTVYGHLDHFVTEVEKYVTNYQYEKKSYNVSIFPPKDKFSFRQGEIIAWSGNTGSSTGPHLHYEIRKSDSENPINPLLFEFGAGDDIKPILERLAIYPLGRHTRINGVNAVKKINLAGGHGNYYISSENEITISGAAGFGIKSYDLLNDSYNKCGIYSTELKIDGKTIFRNILDEFSFAESRYINSHIDYETYVRESVRFERTFLLPNNRLSTYRDIVNRGIFSFTEDRIYHISLEAKDIHGNISVLAFKVKGSPVVAHDDNDMSEPGLVMMPYNRSNRFRAGNIAVSIPEGALYDTLMFRYRKESPKNGMFSELHYVHDRTIPLHKPYSLSIKPLSIPAGKESKLLIINLRDNNTRIPLSGRHSDGFVNGQASVFGMFYIGIDTIPPIVSPVGFSNGADLSGRREMRIRITDNLSGIKTYEPFIDGNWALFEYDQKNRVLIYKFESARIRRGTTHTLTLKVTDDRDNETIFTTDFRW
ncbi:MAG: M23 family metallopeptidase [Bacteroidales bacterium]|nr:M23 family metallopeptidase [Bacteroidales bacterium]